MAAIPKRETTVSRIYETIAKSQDSGFRPHLGASLIGRPCRRQLWYVFRWATRAEFSGRVLRIFARGFIEEDRILRDLRAAGVEAYSVDPETGQQFRFSEAGGHVGGAMDGCALNLVEAPKTWHVLEVKTHNTRSFKELEKKGVEQSKPEHWAQCMLYMHWSGMKRAAYLAVNKDDESIYLERIRYDKDAALKLVDKARAVVEAPEPLERISDKPEFYLCKWCDFSPVCHGGKVPEVNCRTCAHATPELDGDGRWSCAFHRRDLTTDEQAAGCPDHVFIPALVPYEMVEGNANENRVTYRIPGTKLTVENGSGEANDSHEFRKFVNLRPLGVSNNAAA